MNATDIVLDRVLDACSALAMPTATDDGDSLGNHAAALHFIEALHCLLALRCAFHLNVRCMCMLYLSFSPTQEDELIYLCNAHCMLLDCSPTIIRATSYAYMMVLNFTAALLSSVMPPC